MYSNQYNSAITLAAVAAVTEMLKTGADLEDTQQILSDIMKLKLNYTETDIHTDTPSL